MSARDKSLNGLGSVRFDADILNCGFFWLRSISANLTPSSFQPSPVIVPTSSTPVSIAATGIAIKQSAMKKLCLINVRRKTCGSFKIRLGLFYRVSKVYLNRKVGYASHTIFDTKIRNTPKRYAVRTLPDFCILSCFFTII
jgi:hypothetical protein